MSRLLVPLSALALALGSFGCDTSRTLGESGNSEAPAEKMPEDPPESSPAERLPSVAAPQHVEEPAAAAPQHVEEPAAAPQPERPDASDQALRPPPVVIMGTGRVPPQDPACPKSPPQAGNPCEVAAARALSCAWEQAGALAQCACVAKEGMPAGVRPRWNCEEGPSGEGPSTNTCPDQPPTTGTACSLAGNFCQYSSSSNCYCEPSNMQWNCEYNASLIQ